VKLFDDTGAVERRSHVQQRETKLVRAVDFYKERNGNPEEAEENPIQKSVQ